MILRKLLFILIIFFSVNAWASGGTLKQKSIIECNGVYYGNHGNPLHWHKAKLVKDKWVSDGEETSIPPCYIKPVNTFEEVTFSNCIDGDTAKFIIKNDEKTVRMLAINTPEVKSSLKEEEKVEPEAMEYTCNKLKNAKKITLEYDSNSDIEDKYGRVLAFVFVDDELLEASLIKNGLAEIKYVYGDYNHLDELRELESIAKEEKIGIWSSNLPDVNEKVNDSANISFLDILIIIFKTILNFIVNLFA